MTTASSTAVTDASLSAMAHGVSFDQSRNAGGRRSWMKRSGLRLAPFLIQRTMMTPGVGGAGSVRLPKPGYWVGERCVSTRD